MVFVRRLQQEAMIDLRSVLDTLGQPEYTGENRCLACTALNLAIAVGIAIAVGRRRRGLAGGWLAVAVVLIALRGYLIPGTPELSKRYLPDRVLAWFGKNPRDDKRPEIPEEMRELAARRAAAGGETSE
jgi:hypothetical protein